MGITGELSCGDDGRFSVLRLKAADDQASLLRVKVLASAAYGVAMERTTFIAAIDVERIAEEAHQGGAPGHAAEFYPGVYSRPSALVTATVEPGSITFEVGVYGP